MVDEQLTHTLLNPNLDSNSYSNDNFLQHELDMGCTIALVRNSPKLVAMNADSRVNITSIYRAAGDGNFSKSPSQFVAERHNAAPEAAYIHLTNEAGLPPELGAWSLECAAVAEAIGVKVVAFNAATNTDVSLWRQHASTIKELTRRGHKIGIHLYLDGVHDDGGYAALDYLYALGSDCFITEYGFIRNITNANQGYRGALDDGYGDWLEAHAAKLSAYGWPAYLFSIDQWMNDATGKAEGFGTEDRPHILQRCKVINQEYPLVIATPPPPIYPTETDPAAKVVNQTAGLKLRDAPNGAQLGIMPYKAPVLIYGQPVIDNGGYSWQRVDWNALKGWAANNIGGVPSFVDGTAPRISLHAPFKKFVITSHFNDPRDYSQIAPDRKQLHEGTDYVDELTLDYGSDPMVHVCAPGTVQQVGFDANGYGNFVVVAHADNFSTVYGHLAEVYVKQGDHLPDWKIIGLMGATGHASGAHLHLTLSNPNIGASGYVYPGALDPEKYMVAPQSLTLAAA